MVEYEVRLTDLPLRLIGARIAPRHGEAKPVCHGRAEHGVSLG